MIIIKRKKGNGRMLNKDMKYIPMSCPVCDKFYFSKLQNADYQYDDYVQCSSCGWKYDYGQYENPDLRTGENEKSLNEYKKWYEEQVAINPDYNYLDVNYSPIPHPCPVCGKHIFADESDFGICPVCGWCNDGLMEDEPDKWAGCANDLCLNDYIKRYKAMGKSLF